MNGRVMSGLFNYETESGGISSELRAMLDECGLRRRAEELSEAIGLEGLLLMTEGERDDAMKFLSKTPKERAKAVARIDDRSATLLVLRARYFGLRAMAAIGLAMRLENIPGSSYRAATVRAARDLEAMEAVTFERLLSRSGW